MHKSLLLAFFISFSALVVHAEDIAKDHPCHGIKSACEAAGFTKGAHKGGKGLWKDCMNKLKAGEAVEGVNIPPGEVEACKEKVAHRKAKKT